MEYVFFRFVPWMNGISKTIDFENVLEYLKEEFKFRKYRLILIFFKLQAQKEDVRNSYHESESKVVHSDM